jgi:hypothetical protein
VPQLPEGRTARPLTPDDVDAAAGCGTAGPQVDSGNATGAPALYRRLGFEPVRTRTSWVHRIPAGG